MAPSLADYVQAGYALTPGERLEAARLLRLSVDHDPDASPEDIAAAWQDELHSRVDDLSNGTVKPVDAEETYRMLAAKLAAKRQ